jgi:methionine synthase I (cobalamin-dependent)
VVANFSGARQRLYSSVVRKPRMYQFQSRPMQFHTVYLPSLGNELYMNRNQLRELVAAGIEIGAHTRSHPWLAGLPVAGCMSFDSGKNFLSTLMGVSVDRMVEIAEGLGADMIGANCGVGIENYMTIAEALLKKSRLPVWIKANAGLPRMENGRTVYAMEPDSFAEYAATLAKMGVRVIGGCCGTTPAFISASRKALDSLNLKI